MAYFLAYRSDCACTLVPSQSLITVACAICQPARAAEPDDPVRKMLPEWLEAKVKEVEVALRLYVPKKSDWQKSRKETQVHLRNIVQPWKITEAQLRKIGDQDLEAEKEWAQEIQQELCNTIKEASAQQLATQQEKDLPPSSVQISTGAASEGDEDEGRSGVGAEQQPEVGEGVRSKRKRQKVSSFIAEPNSGTGNESWLAFTWTDTHLKDYYECTLHMYECHVRTHGRKVDKANDFKLVAKKFHSKLAKCMHKGMHERETVRLVESLKKAGSDFRKPPVPEGLTPVPAVSWTTSCIPPSVCCSTEPRFLAQFLVFCVLSRGWRWLRLSKISTQNTRKRFRKTGPN